MERKWTKDLLAQILFTAHECAILERLVQREMRGGAESVLEPEREGKWTSERHAAAREQLGAADMDKSFLLEMEFPAALDEIGRLQVIVAMLKQAATPPE